MSNLLSFIWFWSLVSLSQVELNIFKWDESNTSEYVVTDITIYNTGNHGLISLSDSVKNCTECHDDLMTQETVHAPVKKDCNRCHVATGEQHTGTKTDGIGFKLKQDVPGLCYECHDPMDDKEFVHDPIQKGECLTCHDAHTSPNLYLVKENPVGKLCLDCHDLEIPKDNFVHGAVSDGDCQGCHNPHQANNKSFIANTKLDRLCKKCHKSFRKELKKEHVHDPFKKKSCFDCHNPHSSKEEHLSDLKPKDLCLSCHEDTHNTITNAKLVHGAINETETCLNCHAPHASAEKKILKSPEKEMCLECHNKGIESETGNVSAIGPHLVEGNTVHGAIEEDGCIVCHKPHTSEIQSLLNMEFPTQKYVKATVDNFELCFSCHDKALIESPITKTGTDFRDGDQNLHFVHIQNDRGRNCTLCHDVHGTKNTYLIKKETRYGSWDMPIEFEHTDTGGSCLTGCHKKLSYERIVLPDSLKIKE